MKFIEYCMQHPGVLTILSIISTWVFNNIITNAVASLPSPGKDATAKYIFWFQFLNRFVGNYKRANNSSIENSPNWQEAVQKHLETMKAQNDNRSS